MTETQQIHWQNVASTCDGHVLSYIDSWIGNDDEFLMQRFSDAYETIADNIVVAFSKN